MRGDARRGLSRRVLVRLTPGEKAELLAAAVGAGMSIREYLRAAGLMAARLGVELREGPPGK